MHERTKMVQNYEIGERLRELRKTVGLSQEKLGMKFDLARTVISEYENGYKNVPLHVILRYAEEFNVSLDWIIKGVELPASLLSDHIAAYRYKELIEAFNGIHSPMLREVAIRQLKELQTMNYILE